MERHSICDNKVCLFSRSAFHISINERNYPYRFAANRRIKLPRCVQIFGTIDARCPMLKKKKKKSDEMESSWSEVKPVRTACTWASSSNNKWTERGNCFRSSGQSSETNVDGSMKSELFYCNDILKTRHSTNGKSNNVRYFLSNLCVSNCV